MSTSSAILLVTCPDRPGLVATLTRFLADHGGNILDLSQHVDPQENVFFMRVEWDLEAFSIPRDLLAAEVGRIAEPLGLRWSLRFSDDRARMAIFVSREAHCLYDLLSRHESGELPAEIPLIVSNHETLAHVAERFDIPFRWFPIAPDTKAAEEKRQLALLAEHEIDVVVLARYMQVLSPDFTAAMPNRIVNIHHSFLPAFPGGRPYHSAFRRGVKIIGATSHYVTEDLDEGPIIEQDVVRVSHRDSIADLVRKGRDLEKSVLARAVLWHLQHRLLVYGNKTVVFA